MSEPASVSENRKPVILVVDDDHLMRVMLRDSLTAAGFDVILAEDGVIALHHFTSIRPDLVLLDLIMPGKDGCETCRDLRTLPKGQHIHVLMMTCLDNADSIHRAFEAGATDFIAKPLNPELLVHRVRYMLRASQSVNRLAENQARLEMLKVAVDNLPIGITFSDVNGIIIYSNPAEAQMHGYEVSELIGKEARKFSTSDRRRPMDADQLKNSESGGVRALMSEKTARNSRHNSHPFRCVTARRAILESSPPVRIYRTGRWLRKRFTSWPIMT